MRISDELKSEIDRELVFKPAPCAQELNREVRDLVQDNYEFGKRVTLNLVLGYLRHNYTNWPLLHYKMQSARIWSVQEHHTIRNYVNQQIWRVFEFSIPWELG